MSYVPTAQSLSFVWPPQYYTPQVAEQVRRDNGSVILDVADLTIDQLAHDIANIQGAELKLSLEQLFSQTILELVKIKQIKAIWVEYYPQVSSCGIESFLQRSDAYDFLDFNLVTGDLDVIRRCFENPHNIAGLAVKGTESSGFVCSETILSLLSHLEEIATSDTTAFDIHVWGGVFVPEGVAACLASGVSRVVFENLHWLTDDLIGGDGRLSKQLSRLRLDHTSTIEIAGKLHVRVFDKGNSRVVKKLKNMINDGLKGSKASENPVSFIRAQSVPLLQAEFDGSELIFMGPETVFTSSFTKRFGSETFSALHGFIKAVDRLRDEAHQALPAMLEGSIRDVLNVRYPFIQGAMSWISDIPEFALAIAKAGGLPTVAMGIKSIDEIEREFTVLYNVLRGHSFAVNVITLPENPHLSEQLAWLERNKPPFVVISAGDPAYAVKLQAKGIGVMYVTADIDLLQLAWDSGIDIVICEGNEAGGHVGVHSTLTLAQAALELKRGKKKSKRTQYLFLAGGIYNNSSLFRAAVLGADGVQMGTRYLFSKEAVHSGALSKLYQQELQKSSFGDTVITGESVGLRVRSISSPKTEKIRELEQEALRKGAGEADTRQRLENLTVGSLLVAARNKDPLSGEILPEDTCYREGQFMSGAVAGNLQGILPVQVIHERLAQREFKKKLPQIFRGGQAVFQTERATAGKERLAITGVSAVNSLGNSPEEILKASLAMQSGITEVPRTKWNHDEIYKYDFRSTGTTYCRVGAFLSLDISRKELGIAPHDFRTMSEASKLTLWLAQKAIEESRILRSDIPRHRIGVIVSQNAGEFASTTASLTINTVAKEIADSIRNIGDFSDEQVALFEQNIKAGKLAIDDTTLLGRLNCIAAGSICNKYGFRGPSFSVTAACASSLTALFNAVQMLRNGVLDAAIIGGGEELLTPASFLEFSALGALAGKGYDSEEPSTFSRPFDGKRSGMVLGEGGGIIVLERESVAKKRGAPILAYITGVGASNNDQGIIESVASVQQIAIQNSFEDAGYGPDRIDMVECHATATQQGDIEEVEALKAIFSPEHHLVLSSFKSQIGHTLGASGINSLIRGMYAMKAGFFPPTLNYEHPDPDIGLEEGGFRICRRPEPWPNHVDRPRRFEVNAFGFGGGNYVVQLEDCEYGTDKEMSAPGTEMSGRVETSERSGSLGVSFYKTKGDGKELRIGVAEPGKKASEIENELRPYAHDLAHLSPTQRRKLEKQNIVIDTQPGPVPLAMVFAGQGTHYSRMGSRLYQNFPVMRQWMDTLADLADFDLLHILFEADADELKKTEFQQPALFLLEYALYKQLCAFRLQPTAMAGHSMGELTALCVAGCFSYEDGFRLISKRAQLMAKASQLSTDPGTMLAINTPEEYLKQVLSDKQELFITNFNSPRQTVVGGPVHEIEKLKSSLDRDGYWNVQLPVPMAFHSPVMKIIRDESREYISGINIQAPHIPVLSNTTCKPYPEESSEIKKMIISHLEAPVHWQTNVQSLVNEFDCRLFVEIGPQDTLCNLIRECDDKVHCINSCSPADEVQALRKAVASLYVKGALEPDDVEYLSIHGDGRVKKPAISKEDILGVIQKEIYSFALHGAQRYLKPAIIKEVQRKIDPEFTLDDLAEYLPDTLSPGFPTLDSPVPEISRGRSVQDPANRMNEAENRESDADVHDTASTDTDVSSDEDSVSAVVLEQVIQIIMNATGYERDEINPEMDLREDLAISSSRIPIIADAVEKTFDITTSLEDFLGVRTVRDVANRVAGVMEDGGQLRAEVVPVGNPVTYSTPDSTDIVSSPDMAINRFVNKNEEISWPEENIIPLESGSRVLLLSLTTLENVEKVIRNFKKAYQLEILHLRIDKEKHEDGVVDFLDLDEAERIITTIAQEGNLAGIVLLSDSQTAEQLTLQETSSLISGFFLFFQHFLRSDERRFAAHFHLDTVGSQTASVLYQAILGFFLTVAKEYQALCVHSLVLSDQNDLESAIPIALNSSIKVMGLRVRGQHLYTDKAVQQAIGVPEQPVLNIRGDDVIVLTGGGRGVTSWIARSLAPFGCRLVLLGRAVLDTSISFDDRLSDPKKEESFISSYLKEHYGDLSRKELKSKRSEIRNNLEIQRTLAELERLGADAEYVSCDVTIQDQVDKAIKDIADRYGKIDGIIHGAGIIRDSYIPLVKRTMLKEVMDVKLSGAANLLQVAVERELRFVVALSSIAGIGGSIGQANYSIANRAMAAYCRNFRNSHESIITKVFWLPPIEGAGMADVPEIKDILQQSMGDNVFLEVNEASEIILRELLCGPVDDCWIIPVRYLPLSETVLGDRPVSDSHWFEHDKFSMIDKVEHLDLRAKAIQASRIITSQRDLWLNDHKPSKLLKYPIVSAVMAIEAFLEISRLLFPYQQVTGLQNMKFLRMAPCPPELETELHFFGKSEMTQGRQVCNVELKMSEKTVDSQSEPSLVTFFLGQVLVDSTRPLLGHQETVSAHDEPILSRRDIIKNYEKYSALTNRYHVLDSIIKCSSDRILAKMVYPAVDDFSDFPSENFQYPHYLLEALMQTTFCHKIIHHENDYSVMIPQLMNKVLFLRNCQSGETLFLEGSLLSEDSQGTLWDLMATDEEGNIIMTVEGFQMKRVD